MYHKPIDRSAARQIEAGSPLVEMEQLGPSSATRLWSVLIVCGLPLIGIYVLFNLLWSDFKALGRGLSLFHSAVNEELSRTR